MVIQEMVLDPNAQAYTDDEIVGKVNTAAVAISRVDAIDGAALGDCDLDDLGEGSTNKHLTSTKDTKLTGIAEGAEVNIGEEFLTAEKTKLTGIAAGAQPDQTGAEVRDLIVSLADLDRKLVISDPQTGEFKVVSVQRKADGKLGTKYDDVAV